MRSFWFSLLFFLPVAVINFYYVPAPWSWLVLLILATLGALVFVNNLELARRNLDLVAERGRLESIVVNLQDGVVSYDTQFRILDMNPAALRIFGIKREEVLNKIVSPQWATDARLQILTKVIFPSLAPSVIKRSEVGKYPQVIDISFDNPELELRVLTDRFITADGKVVGFIKIIHDRTREVEFLRSKSEFITVAAHQLRTPLTGISWIFQTLRDSQAITGEDRELVEAGIEASAKAQKIIDDMLDVTKIEEGRFGYTFENIDLVKFLREIVFSARTLAKEYGVSVSFESREAAVEIQADPRKLGVAISNLVDNAIKYNVKNGQVILSLNKLPDKPYVLITVKDTGIGIPPQDIKKLFTKFYRSEKAMKIDTEGSGLGLYIAKNIILRHGGNIWAESIVNRGSTFYVTLPTDPRLIPPKEIAYGEI